MLPQDDDLGKSLKALDPDALSTKHAKEYQF